MRVAYDLIDMIEKSFKENSSYQNSQDLPAETGFLFPFLASQMGYLQAIDYQCLLNIARKNQLIIEIHVRSGHFIRKEAVVAKINTKNLSEKTKNEIAKSFLIGKERSPTQDIEYAIDQLVAIALRALSTNANDTFTANSCIEHLGAALCLICQKNLDPPDYDKNSYIRLVSRQVKFEGLVDASFNQIRQYGHSIPLF